jgi:guanylate kinase
VDLTPPDISRQQLQIFLVQCCFLIRPGEQDGVHYNFVPRDVMEEAIQRGEFVEHAVVHTNMYGTSVKAVEKVL